MKHILIASLLVTAVPVHAATVAPLAFTFNGNVEVTDPLLSRVTGPGGNALANVERFRVRANVRDRPGGNLAFAYAGVLDLVSFSADSTVNYRLRQRERLNFGGPDGEAMGLAWVAVADVTDRLNDFEGHNDPNFFDAEMNFNGTQFDFRGARAALGGSLEPSGFFTEGLEPGRYDKRFAASNTIEAKSGRTYAVQVFTWVLGDGGDARSTANLRFRLEDGVSMKRGEAAAPVPIPAGVWLLGTGILAMLGIRRRRKVASA